MHTGTFALCAIRLVKLTPYLLFASLSTMCLSKFDLTTTTECFTDCGKLNLPMVDRIHTYGSLYSFTYLCERNTNKPFLHLSLQRIEKKTVSEICHKHRFEIIVPIYLKGEIHKTFLAKFLIFS